MRRIFARSVAVAAAPIRFYGTRQFTDTHEWLEESNGEITVGISTYAQENLGDVVFVSLPHVGDTLVKKDVLGEVESVKATSNVYSPVDGVVTAVNESLKDEPGLINQSAEDKGWLVKVKNFEMPVGLMSEEEYKKFLDAS